MIGAGDEEAGKDHHSGLCHPVASFLDQLQATVGLFGNLGVEAGIRLAKELEVVLAVSADGALARTSGVVAGVEAVDAHDHLAKPVGLAALNVVLEVAGVVVNDESGSDAEAREKNLEQRVRPLVAAHSLVEEADTVLTEAGKDSRCALGLGGRRFVAGLGRLCHTGMVVSPILSKVTDLGQARAVKCGVFRWALEWHVVRIL